MTPARSPTPAAEAAAFLSLADPVMAALVERHGPPLIGPRTGGRSAADRRFAALSRSVLFQQLAGSAARAIHGRFRDAVGGTVTPEAVLRAGPARLQAAGLSSAKASSILALAAAASSGEIDLARIGGLPEPEIEASLVRVRGIGPWTVHMFCIFELGRPDVWPTTDFGVRKGYARSYGWEELPSPRELQSAGEVFRPHRSAAAWYLWRSAEESRS